jgi:hypothetical protein
MTALCRRLTRIVIGGGGGGGVVHRHRIVIRRLARH